MPTYDPEDQIRSGAYRQVQEIRGKADAEANALASGGSRLSDHRASLTAGRLTGVNTAAARRN